jgi:acetyltransferase, GNAT family
MIPYSTHLSQSLIFRKAYVSDIPAIASILRMAVKRMLAEGKHQWNENYPNETHISADIDKGNGYVLALSGRVIGYAAVVFTGEPAYNTLKGEWLSEGKYVVAHRLAVSEEVKSTGMGRILMEAIERYSRSEGMHSFRIDTNYDNSAMLSLLDRLRFTYCGEIEYEHGVRKAFEKLI